jgi:hypothetical protein
MNKEAKKTLIFAGTAVVLVLLAVVTRPSARSSAEFTHQGEEFYPAFKDPQKAASLEVIDYDELTGAYKPFKVQVANGQWSIPSHSDYPADGKDRLAKTAASVMDLKKEQIASENPKQHEEFGVVDPLDAAAPGTRGRGKRVRLFDASGTVLADYIFGKEVKERPDHRYIRVPEQKQTYAVKVQPDISVKFEDWVETDLLQMGSVAVRKVVIDRYSFDLDQQKLKDRSTHFLVKEEGSAPWKLSELKDTEEVNTETVTTLTSTLSGLKLTGVRRKPAHVAKVKDLSELSKLPRQTLMAVAQSMAQHGFFIMSEGNNRYSVVSNEGEMEASCDDGVVYTLRFGEVLVGSGEEVSAGAPEKKDDKKDEKKDEKKEDKKNSGGTENRYLYVSVRYDETLLGAAPAAPAAYAADPAKKPEEQKADEEKAKKAKEEYETKKKDWEKKREDGKKRAEKLTARFAEWYYVIPADAFKKLRVDRSQLVKLKEVPKDDKKPDDKKPEDKKPEDKKPEDKKPEDKKLEDKKPEDKKPEDKPKDEKKPEDKKPDEKKPEEKKPDPKKPEEKPKPPDEKKPEDKKP